MSETYYPRTLEAVVDRASRHFPALLVTGARQVGKTTLLRRLAGKDRRYVSLDDPLLMELAREDPALFMQRFPPPVLIDEVQYAPQLLPYVKMAVDRDRLPGGFWLTGSQQFELMEQVGRHLTGRVGVVQLFGLSLSESLGQGRSSTPFTPGPDLLERNAGRELDLHGLYARIWRGSFPVLAEDPGLDRDLFLGSYLQTCLQRDIQSLAQVGDEAAFLRLLRACAARTAQLLNISELARDADVAPNTAKRWVSILQSAGVLHLLQPWHSNLTSRLTKTPKLYFLDTGLCAYLTQWSSPEALEAGAMAGPILETWIMVELLKSWVHNGQTPLFHFYRDKDQREIDLLIERDGRLHPLEFKRTASPNRRMIRHFHALDALALPRGPGCLLCLAPRPLPLDEQTSSFPAWRI